MKLIWEFEYAPIRLPDPAISDKDITFSSEKPVSGMQITVTVTIRNLGNVDATGVPVEIIASHCVQVNVLVNRVIDIARGASITLTINATLDEGWHSFEILLDPDRFLEEIDEHNNYAERLLLVLPPPPPSPVISSKCTDRGGHILPPGRFGY